MIRIAWNDYSIFKHDESKKESSTFNPLISATSTGTTCKVGISEEMDSQ